MGCRPRSDSVLQVLQTLNSCIISLPLFTQADHRILELQATMESRLNGLPPSQRQMYADLMSEQQTLQQEGKRFEEAIDELEKTLGTQEGELARNPLKQRSLQLQVCSTHAPTAGV